MPRKYKRRDRNKWLRRSTTFKHTMEGLSLTHKVASLARMIYMLQRRSNSEFKNKYTQLTASATGDTPAFFSLVQMIRGDQDDQRVGNQIKCTTIYMNSLIKIHASATNTTLRYIIFLDKQPNKANATAPDLFQDNTVNDIMISPLNPDNRFRFRILYNRLIKLSQEFPSKQIKFFKKLSIKVRYEGNAGTAADITSNNILVCLFSDEVTNDPTVTHSIKMQYVDN